MKRNGSGIEEPDAWSLDTRTVQQHKVKTKAKNSVCAGGVRDPSQRKGYHKAPNSGESSIEGPAVLCTDGSSAKAKARFLDCVRPGHLQVRLDCMAFSHTQHALEAL